MRWRTENTILLLTSTHLKRPTSYWNWLICNSANIHLLWADTYCRADTKSLVNHSSLGTSLMQKQGLHWGPTTGQIDWLWRQFCLPGLTIKRQVLLKKVQFKTFHLLVKTSHLPDENVDEPPEQIFFGLKGVGGGGGGATACRRFNCKPFSLIPYFAPNHDCTGSLRDIHVWNCLVLISTLK